MRPDWAAVPIESAECHDVWRRSSAGWGSAIERIRSCVAVDGWAASMRSRQHAKSCHESFSQSRGDGIQGMPGRRMRTVLTLDGRGRLAALHDGTLPLNVEVTFDVD